MFVSNPLIKLKIDLNTIAQIYGDSCNVCNREVGYLVHVLYCVTKLVTCNSLDLNKMLGTHELKKPSLCLLELRPKKVQCRETI